MNMPASTLTIADPVCGMELGTGKLEHCYHQNGEMYYFCSAHCYLLFTEDPDRYLIEEEELEH